MKIRFNNDRNCLETNIYFNYDNGKRGSRIIRGNSKKEIEEKASQFLKEISETSLLSNGLTLNNWFNYYIKHICPSINKQSTIDNKVNIFKPMPEHIKQTPLNKLTPETLQIVFDEFQGRYSQNSIAILKEVLSAVLNAAVEFKKISENPMHKVKSKGFVVGKKVLITPSDLVKIVKSIPLKKFQMFVLLVYYSAGRYNEVKSLRKTDFDSKRGLLHFKEQYFKLNNQVKIDTLKTKKSERTVKLPKFISDKLNEFIQADTTDCEYIFHHHGGQLYGQSAIRQTLKGYFIKAGYPDLSSKQLRSSYVKNAVKKNISLKTLQNILGHSKYSTTADIYGSIESEDTYYVADTLEQDKDVFKNV